LDAAINFNAFLGAVGHLALVNVPGFAFAKIVTAAECLAVGVDAARPYPLAVANQPVLAYIPGLT